MWGDLGLSGLSGGMWEIENEIRAVVPMVYYHVWDNGPPPLFNAIWYDSTDFVATISKVTDEIVKTVSPDVESEYIPHSVNTEVFKKLEAPFISNLLRALFPKFFLMIFALSLTNFIMSMISKCCALNMLFLSSSVLAIKCYLLIGMTNKATDSGDKKKFALLHRISVISTVIILLINLAAPFIK